MSDRCQHENLRPVFIPGRMFAVSCTSCGARWKIDRQTLDEDGRLISDLS